MKVKVVILILICLIAYYFYDNFRFNDGKLHLVFCNVGQGDAIFVRTPSGVDILFDGGPDSSVLNCLSRHMPFFDRDLELVFLSHPHADHYMGLIDVLKRYKVLSFNTEKIKSSTISYKELENQIKNNYVSERFLTEGDIYKISDGVVIKMLWPQKKFIDSINPTADLDKNSISLIEMLSFNKINSLLTADIQSNVIDKIYSDYGNFDIIEISHHGSKTGTDKSTFNSEKPKYVVISVGKGNNYGLPSSYVLSILKEKGINIKRTDQGKDVEFVISNILEIAD